MRQQELELIAALAEGSLDDETAARALVESSPEARAEYEAQRMALEVLSEVRPAELSEHERAVLRRDLWTELQADRDPAPTPSTSWYYRWTFAAAGLFVLVGLVAVLSQVDMGGDDAGEEAVAEQLAAPTDRDETTDQGLSADAPEQAGEEDDSGGDDMAEETDGAGTETTAQSAQTLAVPPPATFEEEASRVRSGEVETTDVESLDSEQLGELTSCLEQAGLGDFRPIAESLLTLETDSAATEYVLAVPAEAASIASDTPVAFVLSDICEVAHVAE